MYMLNETSKAIFDLMRETTLSDLTIFEDFLKTKTPSSLEFFNKSNSY